MSKVSVIIATYNRANTLEKALISYLEQSYKSKELIIMDGGSMDDTQQILNRYSSQIDYWESVRDRGIYHAWNKALERATGDWICFIGADDYWAYTDAISDMVQVGTESGAELVSGKVAIVDADYNVKREWGRRWSWKEIKRHHCIAHPGMLHHKSCFSRNGTYNEAYRIAGDYDFSLRLGKDTKAAFINEVFVCMGSSGLSHSMVKETLSEVRDIQSRCAEIGRFRANINYWETLSVVRIKGALGML